MASWWEFLSPTKLFFRDHSDDAGDPVGSCSLPQVHALARNSDAYAYIQACVDIPRGPEVSLEDIVNESANFPRRFAVESVRCKELLKQPGVSEELLTYNTNSAYPLLHECALFLIVDFLKHKRKHGSDIEQALYSEMGLVAMVQRLLDKRAVTYLGYKECFLLVGGEVGYGGWDVVGTEKESPPLTLENCLSYDEMKLSALLSVSSHTVFINDGSRKNRGVLSSPEENIEKKGVIVGLIGPKLTRKGVNEYQDILVTADQNTEDNGYGIIPESSDDNSRYEWRRIWARFYGIDNLPSYCEAAENYRASKWSVYKRFTELTNKELFDNVVYKKRIAVSVETLLLEAEYRAASVGTTAYVHVVGIGLGAWRISHHQEKEFLIVFASCLKKLSKKLQHVSDVRFGWFEETKCGGVGDGGIVAGHIRIHFSSDPPHVLLKEDAGKLLVVSYAWDGNALPGNDFWLGGLSTSGDPAAACSTQVAELHNPHVNPTKVCGTNLHVTSPRWGVLHIGEYARRLVEETPQHPSS